MGRRRKIRLLKYVLRKVLAIGVLAVIVAAAARCMNTPVVEASAASDIQTATVRQIKAAPVQIEEPLPEPTAEPEGNYSCWEPPEEDVTFLAKTLYGECRGVASKEEQAAVAWCILNRVSSPRFKGDTVREIVTAPYQFAGYSSSFPVTDELKELAIDVLTRWHAEYCGLAEDVGRTLPSDYYFFSGDGVRNYFRKEYKDEKCWNWSLKSPYEGGAE